MWHRLARIGLAAVLLLSLSLITAGSVAGKHPSSGPDVSIRVSGPGRIMTGSTHVYQIKATNVGSGRATNVAVSGSVGDQFNPLSLRCPKGWHIDGSACAGSLGAHKTATFEFKVKVCCLFQGEDRHASVMAMYFSSDFTDPTPADDWISKPVYIAGPWMN